MYCVNFKTKLLHNAVVFPAKLTIKKYTEKYGIPSH